MLVQLHVYLESGQDGPIWWSESPDVPGFHAIADRMPELIVRSHIALVDILRPADGLKLQTRLMGQPPGTKGGPDSVTNGDLSETSATTGTPSILVSV